MLTDALKPQMIGNQHGSESDGCGQGCHTDGDTGVPYNIQDIVFLVFDEPVVDMNAAIHSDAKNDREDDHIEEVNTPADYPHRRQ